MSKDHAIHNRGEDTIELHADLGPGGMRIICLCSCLMMICEQFAELQRLRFTELRCTSGSTLIGMLKASGMSAREIQRELIQENLRSHLLFSREIKHSSPSNRWQSLANLLEKTNHARSVLVDHYWRLHRFRGLRPVRGLYNAEGLINYVEEHAQRDPLTNEPIWPKGFICFVVYEDQESRQEYQLIGTDHAVFLRSKDGVVEQVSDEPGPIGPFIAASCAIPLIFEKVRIQLANGRVFEGLDGGMSWEGAIPLHAATAVSQGSAQHRLIVDVGEEPGRIQRAKSTLFSALCGGRCIPFWTRVGEMFGILPTTPQWTHLHVDVTRILATEFGAGADKKWAATAECYGPCIRMFENLGLLYLPESVAKARRMAEELEQILKIDDPLKEGALSALIEEVFTRYEAYGPN